MVNDTDSYERLDPAVIRLWRIQALITVSIIAVTSLIPIGILTATGKIPSVLPAGLQIAGLVGGAIFTLWFAAVAYRHWGYRIQKSGTVQLRRGVVFTREIHIPLGRVQHVDIEQGPLERRLGLMRLILFTAGTKDARQVIPGLLSETAEAFRDELARRADQLHTKGHA